MSDKLRSTRAARQARPRSRAGVTLLELILSLALSVIVIAAVAMAINVFLRTLDSRRNQVEETQIARAVLRLIADDLRGAVQHEELDFSKVTGIGVVASAAAAAGGDSASAGGAAPSGGGGASGPASSSAATKGAGSTPAASSATKGGGGGGGGGMTKSPSTSSPAKSASSGASGGGAAASGSPQGGSGGGGSSGAAASGASPSSSSSNASQNIQQTTDAPPQPGLFGNQYELMIDVSRLPRLDEQVSRQMSADGQSVVDLPSDIKTIAYYVRTMTAQPGTGFSAATNGSALGRELRRPGLVRRQMDRAVTLYATQSGRTTDLQKREQLVAPEVSAVEFRYFDGSQWVTEWDSIQMQGLPKAVEIMIAVQPGGEQLLTGNSTTAMTMTPASTTGQAPLIFRQLVRLPAARTCTGTASTSTDSSDSAASGGGTTGSAGGGSGGIMP